MRTFKYVVVDNGCDTPRIGTEAESHADLAGNLRPIAAGFGELYFSSDGQIEVSCWGKSESLKVASRGSADESLIHRMFVEPVW